MKLIGLCPRAAGTQHQGRLSGSPVAILPLINPGSSRNFRVSTNSGMQGVALRRLSLTSSRGSVHHLQYHDCHVPRACRSPASESRLPNPYRQPELIRGPLGGGLTFASTLVRSSPPQKPPPRLTSGEQTEDWNSRIREVGRYPAAWLHRG